MHAIVTGDDLARLGAGKHAPLQALESRVRRRRLQDAFADVVDVFDNLHKYSPYVTVINRQTL